MTLDEIAAVINNQFESAEAFGVALQLLDARMDIELANGAIRIAQGVAGQAQQQANIAIQTAQAAAPDAQSRFDQIVASLNI